MPRLDPHDLPLLEDHEEKINRTSSDIGRGREECIRQGGHEWKRKEFHYSVVRSLDSPGTPNVYVFVVCARCGELGNKK